jgi:hypothetical protein
MLPDERLIKVKLSGATLKKGEHRAWVEFCFILVVGRTEISIRYISRVFRRDRWVDNRPGIHHNRT